MMTERFSESQMLKLVEIYRDYDCLWDVTHPEYKNRETRDSAYRVIYTRLNVPTLTLKDVPKKIKNLRSSYYQELKKIDTAGGPEFYTPKVSWFATADGFLKPFRNKHDVYYIPQLRGATSEKSSKKRTFRRAAQFTPTAARAASSDNEEGDMTDFERQLLVLLKRMESPLEEDDESFFRSMAPILRTFDNEHKLLFRSRVMAVALDLQMQGGSVYVEAPSLHHEEELPEEDADEPPEKKYRPPDADADGDDSTSDDS